MLGSQHGQHPIDFVCGWRFAQLGATHRFEPALQELINAAFIPGVQGAQQTAELHLTYRTRFWPDTLLWGTMNTAARTICYQASS
ncbi:hypothetical protein AV530_004972 [Patagioenas fasciata monilis]|uniref:Uncharacterized protein n=1 Tax=Patagioenas fasciata monilis TaxID=372326 RepID=A0A1V4K3Q8_PATFA|nr:hypothetical protein AV530_004972 [Patagioenas fasciata monilis]